MTLLSDRVKKAKRLRITQTNGHYNTWGNNDDLYIIHLKSGKKHIVTPDGWLTVPVFYSKCEKLIRNLDGLNGNFCDCKGNIAHTVCYHCLGAIWKSFKDTGSQVSFFETYHDAINGLNFGGYIAKIENNNGRGSVWCTVRKPWQKRQELKFQEILGE